MRLWSDAAYHAQSRSNAKSTVTTDTSSTLTDQAFTRLRADVLAGTFPPGAKLKMDDLQAAYGFSSSPLREALSRLSQEGLIRSDERRGFRVPPLTLEDLADITRMRLMLEVSALGEAIEHGDDRWEAAIVAAYYRLEKVEARFGEGSTLLNEEWRALHRDFHVALLAACPSRRHLNWCFSLFDLAERYRQFSATHRMTPRRRSDEHRKLMEATLQRDRVEACELLMRHIESTKRNVEEALRALEPAVQA